MKIKTITRKDWITFVREMKVSDLDKSKCSHKFLQLNLPDDTIVNVKCYKDGSLDLRGKKEEYRILVDDNSK
jgi:hypothetical protein